MIGQGSDDQRNVGNKRTTPDARGAVLGVLGGSGLYELDGLTNVEELGVDTPFGSPSDVLVRGRYGEATLIFLPRHGRGHRIPPHAINYRANVAALKIAGATHLLSVSAVGSMKEEIAPGDLVVVDQFVDLSKRRASTFFDEDIAAHVSFSDPVCPLMGDALASAAVEVTHGHVAKTHRGGMYVCMEGPQFSSRAESLIYRSWGASVIGMTAMPEAKLAREAELPYACLALATDYDCWHQSEEAVSVEAVVAMMKKNVVAAKNTLAALATQLPDAKASAAHDALRHAVMTSPERITDAARARLGFLMDKYWK